MTYSWPEGFRAGFASMVGRPNAGKSTLTNALVGQKVAITSGRPQTTRHTVRGIVHRADGQLVLVDTPGLHRPRTLLGERLNDLVRETISEVDVVVFCLPADEKIGPGDRYIARELAETMVALGQDAGVHTVALMTDMSTPLGLTAGNGLEVRESVEVLAGGGPQDVVELTLALAREMLAAAGIEESYWRVGVSITGKPACLPL